MVYCIVLVVASVLGELVVLWAVINSSGIGGLFVGEIETILSSRVIHGGRTVVGEPMGPLIARSVECVGHDSVLFYILAWKLETGRRACRGGIRSAGIDQVVRSCGGDPGTDVDIEPEQGVGREVAVESGDGSMEEKSGIVGQKGQGIGLRIIELL